MIGREKKDGGKKGNEAKGIIKTMNIRFYNAKILTLTEEEKFELVCGGTVGERQYDLLYRRWEGHIGSVCKK